MSLKDLFYVCAIFVALAIGLASGFKIKSAGIGHLYDTDLLPDGRGGMWEVCGHYDIKGKLDWNIYRGIK